MLPINSTVSQAAIPGAQRSTGPAATNAATTSESAATPSLVSNQTRPTRTKAADVFATLRDPARSNHEKTTLLLDAITNGVDNINAKDRVKGTGMEQWSLLHHAVNLDNPTALKAILNAPHIALHTGDKSGSTALHLGAKQGKTEAVDALLNKHEQMNPGDKGSLFEFVNATNGAFRTPMHLAATAPGGVSVMQRLLKAGGDVDPTTRTGLSTPLSYAVKAFAENRNASIDAAKWLVANGANVDTPLLIHKTNRTVTQAEARQRINGNYTTPMRIASENNWHSLVRALGENAAASQDAASPTSPQIHQASATFDAATPPDATHSLEKQLRTLALSDANAQELREYAERLCQDCFDEEAALRNSFYSSETPSEIAMELRNRGMDTSDIDAIDTLRYARESCGDHRAEWIEGAIEHIAPSIQDLVSRKAATTSDDYSNLRDTIGSFYFSEARGLMWDMIRDQFQGAV